jgi:threonylcarbamoyladenosine tRNA methylthiotransferase MtaB
VGSFYVENFGCRATQADGAAIEEQLRHRGLHRAVAPEHAELVVLNTCTVTAAADQDARAAIRRINRENPGCRILVTGCYAQRAPEELAALPGVTWVIGNSHKHQLVEIAAPAICNSGSRTDRASPVTEVKENRESANSARPGDAALSSRWEEPNSVRERSAPGLVPLSTFASDQRELVTENRIFVSDIFAHTELLAAPVFDAANERTRPNLKVQDGCDNRCSFCVIPYVRGQSRSLRLEEALRQVSALVQAGYREVVISGINLGRWGRDLVTWPEAGQSRVVGASGLGLATGKARVFGFVDLIRAVLAGTSVEKLRISSVEPMDWTDELIHCMADSPRVAKHAHVPMQSGSDAVLRRMHRKYRPWHYREKIEKIRAALPAAAIGADVMVGFPGETEAEFEETRRMIEELSFTYLHVFTYSPRPGTPAAAMPNQVPIGVARERNHILRELAAEKKLAFMRSFIGRTVDAITLNIFEGESTEALTDNYLKLQLKGRHEANHWLSARVDGVQNGALLGSL